MTARRTLLFVLAACGGGRAASSSVTTPPPARATPAATPKPDEPKPATASATDDDNAADKCTTDDKALQLGGAKLEIETCTIDERQGSVDSESTKEAHLLVDGQPAYTLGQWEAGYEWGGSWSLEGVLQGRGAGGIVFASENQSSDAGSSTTLHALQRTGDTWTVLWTEEGTEVELEIAADVVTVRACETDQMSACTDKKAKHRVARWKWDGRTLVAQKAATKRKRKPKKHVGKHFDGDE